MVLRAPGPVFRQVAQLSLEENRMSFREEVAEPGLSDSVHERLRCGFECAASSLSEFQFYLVEHLEDFTMKKGDYKSEIAFETNSFWRNHEVGIGGGGEACSLSDAEGGRSNKVQFAATFRKSSLSLSLRITRNPENSFPA